MRTLRGQAVDRPPVSFYEIGLFKYDFDDPDPYNVHNHPSWKPLIEMAEGETDIIRGVGALTTLPQIEGTELFEREVWEDEASRFTRRTLRFGGRTLTETTRRDRVTDTIWKTEHLLKNLQDLRAYLKIPDELLTCDLDCSDLEKTETALGDAGIVMIDSGDPLCGAADLFRMEDYLVIALTEPALFHQLLEKFAIHIHSYARRLANWYPGRLWRIYGSEYASEPYLPPSLFEEYVCRYTGPMIKEIQKTGGFARLHCHGRLRNILPHIADMGPDALDPIEPPPQGDIDLIDVRRKYGMEMVLFGNLEASDLENLDNNKFRTLVRQALEEGTEGKGKGFVLMPSSSPYGRLITARTMRNYEIMIEEVGRWGGPDHVRGSECS
jgi:hypothetical protein